MCTPKEDPENLHVFMIHICLVDNRKLRVVSRPVAGPDGDVVPPRRTAHHVQRSQEPTPLLNQKASSISLYTIQRPFILSNNVGWFVGYRNVLCLINFNRCITIMISGPTLIVSHVVPCKHILHYRHFIMRVLMDIR